MSLRHHRLWLLPLLCLAGQAWALGLGDIRLDSALNQPLRAEIELLAATPEELNNLEVQLASAETFARYDLERPLYLTRIQFQLVRSGTADGNFVRVTSLDPMTEPFVTFLVEAIWSRGRLLREYTVLLDPPTFAPPPTSQSTQAVTAPTRSEQADSGQIQRAEPEPAPPPRQQTVRPPVQQPAQQPAAEPPQQAEPPAAMPEPVAAPDAPPATQSEPDPGSPDFDTAPGNDVLVVRGDTLWGITNRVRPDSRLTINQTMLAIYEANPEAFEGNINRLRAGARLRIPSADDVFRISRGDAFEEVRRQNEAWGGIADSPTPEPAVAEPTPEPSLTLVPPDDEDLPLSDTSVDTSTDDLADDIADDVFVDPVQQRINEIEALIEDQDALIEIPDTELAALRQELAELRGEELPDPAIDDAGLADPEDDLEDELMVDDEALVDEELGADGEAEDLTGAEPPATTTTPAVVSRPPARDEGIVDTILGYLTNFWVMIGIGLAAAIGLLLWFMRRSTGDTDDEGSGMWESLGDEELAGDSMAQTQNFRGGVADDGTTILVEEQTPPEFGPADTIEAPIASDPGVPESSAGSESDHAATDDPLAATGINQALDDTFSSETSINLDQGNPVSDADFHMAYGLYDQAADLINGALTADPENKELLAKLCEIYFVWGNRDAFIDAAGRMQSVAGGSDDAEWDKIVIMGQQIAGDNEMFSGVSAGAATKAVDLSFDGGDDTSAELDMDFAADSTEESDEVIDLASETGQVSISPDHSSVDFNFEEEDQDDPVEVSATREMPEAEDVIENLDGEDTASAETGSEFDDAAAVAGDPEIDASLDEDDVVDIGKTAESPTIEQQFDVLDATGELPKFDAPDSPIPSTDATAEIDLDDLGLDLDSITDTPLAADVEDAVELDDMDDTAENQGLDIDDELAATGRNPGVDPDQTGIQEGLDIADAMGATELGSDDVTMLASLDDDDAAEDDDAADDDVEDVGSATDVDLDTSLLEATGLTQVISDDMAVDTSADAGADLSDDDKTMLASGSTDEETIESAPDEEPATMLAPLDDDDEEFDFAKTEALPKDVFSSDMSTDDTGRMPGVSDSTGSTDMDLDLDDLTAALKVSEVGDTVNQVRDDATVEQPRISNAEVDLDVGESLGGLDDSDDGATTQAIAAGDVEEDLHDARTMTEVGTKLDLARAYVDMGDPSGARSILEEVLAEGDEGQKQQAQQLIESLPA